LLVVCGQSVGCAVPASETQKVNEIEPAYGGSGYRRPKDEVQIPGKVGEEVGKTNRASW